MPETAAVPLDPTELFWRGDPAEILVAVDVDAVRVLRVAWNGPVHMGYPQENHDDREGPSHTPLWAATLSLTSCRPGSSSPDSTDAPGEPGSS